jgi:RNA polymerase sigma-70 factor (ECF subfamily)
VPLPDGDSGKIARDAASERWLEGLAAEDPLRDRCIRELHQLLLRAAQREVYRRRDWLRGAAGPELDDLAQQAADDALVAVVGSLERYRGASRFTTWAYGFVINHVSMKMRVHAWRERRVPFDEVDWERLPDRIVPSVPERSEQRAQLDALRTAVERDLSPRQREVFVSVALNEVPVDVVAARLDSNRGAIYKTLFDARTKLRACLRVAGYPLPRATEVS